MKRTVRVLRGKTIAIIGLGQIGGSMLKRLSPLRPRINLLAHDRDRRLAAKASRYSTWVTDLSRLVDDADIIILAIPVPAIITMLSKIGSLTVQRTSRLLVLDTGTIKHPIRKHASRFKERYSYVGLHPLAGHEGEGWEPSRADLFLGKQIVHAPGRRDAVAVARELIALLGAEPLKMDARLHDRYVAEAIGLPHLIAFAAQGLGGENPLRAGSWASLTRVAAASPEMVAGFLIANAHEQKRAITRFEREITRLKKLLDDQTGHAVLRMLKSRQRL